MAFNQTPNNSHSPLATNLGLSRSGFLKKRMLAHPKTPALKMYRSATIQKVTPIKTKKEEHKSTATYLNGACLIPILAPAKMIYKPLKLYTERANTDISDAKLKIKIAMLNIKNIIGSRQSPLHS